MPESNGGQSNRNGRGHDGRFQRGNPGGPGRPKGKLSAEQWRQAFQNAVTPADIEQATRVLVELAKGGERWAIELLLNMTVGSPAENALAERLNELEKALDERLP
jgi:hypothetical protein